MISPRPSVDAAGAVLRGPDLQADPVRIGRCREPLPGGSRRSPGDAVPVASPQGAAAGGPRAEELPGFAEGYRAGYAEGEAAQRAREQAVIEAHQRAGFEKGREDGRAQGLEEGRQAGRLEVGRDARATQEASASRLAQLDRLLAALPAELARRVEEAEDDMVALCHAAVCRILGEELVTAAGVAHHVRQTIREAGFPGAGTAVSQLAIHVHPQELAALEADAVLAGWLRQHASAGVVHWVADERVRLGGCLVRSAEGTLDARLETQLAALHRVLAERRAAPAETDAAAERGAAGEDRP